MLAETRGKPPRLYCISSPDDESESHPRGELPDPRTASQDVGITELSSLCNVIVPLPLSEQKGCPSAACVSLNRNVFH
jgi:hypothetical protein